MGRGSVWIPVAGIVCALAFAGVECVTLDQQVVRERLARFVEEQDAKVPPRREAVYGETLEGNAWDHYAQAAAALASQRMEVMPAGPDRWWELKLANQKQPLGDDVAPDLEAALDAALRSIRAGVRCALVRREDRGVSPFHLRALVDRAMDRAFAAGDARLLVELFVDHCTLMQDLHIHVWHTPFRDDWLRGLDAESAAWFVTSLLRVEERGRWCGSLETRLAALVKRYAPLTRLQQSFEAGLGAWRFGFDSNWRELVLCDRIVAVLPRLVPPAPDWPGREAQLAEIHAVLEDFDGGHVPGIHALPTIHDLVKNEERFLRSSVTRLRLLRLAVAFVHGHELPRLADPLGTGPIEVEICGDEATFRSEGMNGKERIARTVRRR